MRAAHEVLLPNTESTFSAVQKALHNFPDVDTTPLFLKVDSRAALKPSPEFATEMVETVAAFDAQLAQKIPSRDKLPYHLNGLFSRNLKMETPYQDINGMKAEEMDASRSHHMQNVVQGLEYADNMVAFFPLNGAAPLMAAIEDSKAQGIRNNIVAMDAPSYIGTTNTDHHEYIFPDQILDPETMVLLADDVVDTVHFALNLAMSRLYSVHKSIPDEIFTLADRVRDARNLGFNHPENTKVWDSMVRVLWEQNVVLAPLVMKNPALQQAIFRARPEDSWQYFSHEFMSDVVNVGPTNWITGGRGRDGIVPMFDIGVKGSSVLQHMDAANQKKYADRGMAAMSFRLGASIPDLVRLVNPATGVDQVTKQFAEFLEGRK